tara:strand:+ start:299 stop:757 length:459 start_codon:yes stop_codon:yes gene_type:complete
MSKKACPSCSTLSETEKDFCPECGASYVRQTEPVSTKPITVSPWARLGANLLEALLYMVTLGIGWIIWALTLSGKGQTPAKKLLDHTVVDMNTGQPLGLGRMFWVRGLVAGFVAPFAFLFSLGILIFMPFWDTENQNIWDKVSGSYVIPTPK